MPPRAGDIILLSVFYTLNNVLGRTVCSRHGWHRVNNSSIALAWRLHGNRRVHNMWNGLDSSRVAERYSLEDRLSRVASDVISISTNRTSARCRENVRSRIWRFVEDRRRFPSAILITEANCLTVVKTREISCVLLMLRRHIVLAFLKSLSLISSWSWRVSTIFVRRVDCTLRPLMRSAGLGSLLSIGVVRRHSSAKSRSCPLCFDFFMTRFTV